MYSLKRRILFPGQSSYPLSPNNESQEMEQGDPVISENDQMIKVLEKINIDSERDTCFLTDEDQIEYVKQLK